MIEIDGGPFINSMEWSNFFAPIELSNVPQRETQVLKRVSKLPSDKAIADNICNHLSKMIQVRIVELRGDTPEDLKPFWLFQPGYPFTIIK